MVRCTFFSRIGRSGFFLHKVNTKWFITMKELKLLFQLAIPELEHACAVLISWITLNFVIKTLESTLKKESHRPSLLLKN